LAPAFPGFPAATMTFLQDLEANNDRAWFGAHRDTYETAYVGAAEAFVAAVEPALEELAGAPVIAKTLRIYRDVRFAKDKSPYNSYLRIAFSARAAGGRNGPMSGYFFGLEPQGAHVGAGVFELAGHTLDRYREAAADDRDGAGLASVMAALRADGLRIDEPALKRVPAPYPADHPRADLLRRKSITAWREITDRRVIEGPDLVGEVLATFAKLKPLNRWIADAIA
jgi:uncharacterized protein (TIGR02453 family)